MDINELEEYFSYAFDSGMVVSSEFYVLLKNSLNILENDNHFDKTYFWGMIHGIDADYYIAFGYRSDILKRRTYYYSRNALDWFLLPRPLKGNYFPTAISPTRFQGDPSIQLQVFDDGPSPDTTDEQNQADPIGYATTDDEEKVLTKEVLNEPGSRETFEGLGGKFKDLASGKGLFVLKEEDRLACVVRRISQEAFVVPRGSLFQRTDGRVVPNPSFGGLHIDEVKDQKNYFHLRIPLQRWDVNLSYREDHNYSFDFMDPIHVDVPEGKSWTTSTMRHEELVTLRSLYWPGLTMFHKIGSKHHGCLYIGTGMKNLDLPFNVY